MFSQLEYASESEEKSLGFCCFIFVSVACCCGLCVPNMFRRTQRFGIRAVLDSHSWGCLDWGFLRFAALLSKLKCSQHFILRAPTFPLRLILPLWPHLQHAPICSTSATEVCPIRRRVCCKTHHKKSSTADFRRTQKPTKAG